MRNLLQTSVNRVPFALRRHVRKVPGLAVLQRWLLANSGLCEPFAHYINAGPAAGAKFEVSLPADKAIWSGTYELEFSRAIAALVQHRSTCFDIGGYRGYMAAVMALHGAARVIVFEPMPSNLRALGRLKQLNPEFPIDLIAAAVGDADGRARFEIMSDASMGKLACSHFQVEAEPQQEIDVEIVQLDSLVESGVLPAPNLIKIDVEGAELAVLAGARGVLAKHRPTLFIEVHSGLLERQCTDMLSGLGYRTTRLERAIASEEHTRRVVCEA